MEKTRNSNLKEFFKNIGFALQSLVADDGVNNEVELTGELAKDPLESFKLSQEVTADKPSKSRKPNIKEVSNVTQTKASKSRPKSNIQEASKVSQTKVSQSRTRKPKEIDHDEI